MTLLFFAKQYANPMLVYMMRNFTKYIILIFAFTNLLACRFTFGQNPPAVKFKFDHLVLFVNDDALKDSMDNFFTPAKKLTSEHKTQGTIGYYYLFLNTYIELLFLNDSAMAISNEEKFGSEYISRWSSGGTYCPVGFGLSMIPWDTSLVKGKFTAYQSSDTPLNEYYLMSIHNKDLNQPLIYVSMPHRNYKPFQSLEEIDRRADESKREDLKTYLTHKSKVKNLTRIVLTGSCKAAKEENIRIVDDLTGIQHQYADTASLMLEFDKGKERRRVYMLNDRMKLIINY